MTTPQPPVSEHDAVLLAAYLHGDLADDQAATLEARLDTEPALAARLEALAQVVARLQRLDEVTPPAGYEQRLRARLDGARAQDAVAAPGATDPMRRTPWLALVGVAAAVAAIALVTPRVLPGSGDTGTDVAAGDATPGEGAGEGDLEAMSRAADETGAAEEAAPAAPPAPGVEVQEQADRRATGLAEPGSGAASADWSPLVVDSGARLGSEGEVRAHFRDLPEVEEILGTPAAHAGALRERAHARIQQSPPFSDGLAPATCLETLAGEGAEAVPARVERVQFRDEPALAYILVTAAGAQFDRVEAWILTPGCDTRLFATLTP